jgi:hypothetical protein
MTSEGFKFWKTVIEPKVPDVWGRLSSSTKKYHRRPDGGVDTIEEHTYTMLYAFVKTMKMFRIKPKTQKADMMLFAITLHDVLKYGTNPVQAIKANRKKFLEIFTESQVDQLEDITRTHAGIWSSDVGKGFTLDAMSPEALVVHTLDMLSTQGLLRSE